MEKQEKSREVLFFFQFYNAVLYGSKAGVCNLFSQRATSHDSVGMEGHITLLTYYFMLFTTIEDILCEIILIKIDN